MNRAENKTRTIEYSDGQTKMEGYIVYDSSIISKRPGIVVVHDWMGLNAFAKKRADDLACLGYTAIAADIFGKSGRPKNLEEAGKNAKKFRSDRQLLRSRVNAAYQVLLEHSTVDSNRTAAIGFCFGGSTVLELARSGVNLKGVVSFHGGLDSPTPDDAKNIKGQVLILHGADDPSVPPVQVESFESEMRAANIKYRIEKYPNAVHAFTNPEVGHDNSKGVAYNANADKKSREEMIKFFSQIF